MRILRAPRNSAWISGLHYDTVKSHPMRKRLRRILLIVGLIFFAVVMRRVLDPFGDYVELSHGNHSHFVPVDRDPNVPIDRFPNRPPGPDERLLPDGRIAPR